MARARASSRSTLNAKLASLHAALQRFAPVAPPLWERLQSLVGARRVARGEQLLRAGEQALLIYFVSSGLLREYYVDGSGRELTRRFCDEGDFSGSLADLLVSRGALVSIEALEPSELLALPWCDIDNLAAREPAITHLLRRFAESLYLRKIEREFEMLTLPALQRYERFIAAQPNVHARVPRHLVASYLGITPVHLSRIATAAGSRTAPAARARRK